MTPRALGFTTLIAMVSCAMMATTFGENTIDFSKSTNLKVVYDAGLRPWRVRADEKDSLNLTDQQIRLIAPGTTPFSFDVEIADFSLLAGNELSKADFISQPIPLADAIAKAREVCMALDVSQDGLEEKAAQLTRLGDQTPSQQAWTGRGEKNGIRFSVTLYPLFGMWDTRGKVYVTFHFPKLGSRPKFLTEPVKQPPGYEHMSMEPPKTNPSKPFPDPAYSFENMKKRIQETKAAEAQPAAPGSTSSSSQPAIPAPPTPNEP